MTPHVDSTRAQPFPSVEGDLLCVGVSSHSVRRLGCCNRKLLLTSVTTGAILPFEGERETSILDNDREKTNAVCLVATIFLVEIYWTAMLAPTRIDSMQSRAVA